MRMVHINDYDYSKMKLAKPVLDSKGRPLLVAGSSIHPQYMDKLIHLGISYLFIEDKESEGITLEEMIHMPTWMDAVFALKEIFYEVEKKKSFKLVGLLQLISKLIDEIKQRSILMPIPVMFLSKDLHLYAHSINVALMSLQIGKKLGYNEINLRDLAVGSLLHDIGKALTSEEENHPEEGFKFLKSYREINLMSAHIAYQHHELYNGKGYPRGISGSTIIEFAQICGISNFYENLISKDNMPPHEAIEVIMALNNTAFSTQMVNVFVQTIPPYLPGVKVLLNNDEKAIVTKIEGHIQRPTIRFLSTEKEISLADHPTMIIKQVLA